MSRQVRDFFDGLMDNPKSRALLLALIARSMQNNQQNVFQTSHRSFRVIPKKENQKYNHTH